MMPACEAEPGSGPQAWPVTRFTALGDSVTLAKGLWDGTKKQHPELF